MCSSSPGRLLAISTLGACEISTIDHMPGRRKFDQPNPAKARAVPREQRFEHLLQAAIDRAHHRHAPEQPLAEIDQGPSDQVGGEEAQQRQRDDGNDQPRTGQPEWQVGFRPVGDGNERPHQPVDPGDEPPGQVEGDRDRTGDNEAGEEIVPESGHQAVVDLRQGIGRRRGRRQIVTVHRGSRSVEAAAIRCQLSHPSRLLKTRGDQRLDHDPIGLNRIMIPSLCLSMIFSENRSPFIGIMIWGRGYSTVTDFARFRG